MYQDKYLKYKRKYLLKAGSQSQRTKHTGHASKTRQTSQTRQTGNQITNTRQQHSNSRCTNPIYKRECGGCSLRPKWRQEYLKYKEYCYKARPPTRDEIQHGKRKTRSGYDGASLSLYEGECRDLQNSGYGWYWLADKLKAYNNDGKNKIVRASDISTYFNKLIQIRDANYNCGQSRDQFSKDCVIDTDETHNHEIEAAKWRQQDCQTLLNYLTPGFKAAEAAKTRRSTLYKIMLKYWNDKNPTKKILAELNSH